MKVIYHLIFILIFFPVILKSQIELGQSTPNFFAYTLENKQFFFNKELEKGKPVLLSFFATYCIPCKTELPLIDSLLNNNILKLINLK